MKIVSISLDPRILDPRSRVSERNLLYGEVVDEYRVVIHSEKSSISERPHSVTVFAVGGKHKFIRFFKIIWLIRRFIKEKNCDVIASSDPYFLGFATLILARIYGVGFELQILGIEKFTPLRKMLAGFVVRHAGSIRVNSTHLRDKVSSEFSVDSDDILFVPTHYISGHLGFENVLPGSDKAQERDLLKNKFNNSYGSAFNLLTVGRLVEVKNIAMQIQAIAKLNDSQKNVHLHVVGEGSEEKTLEKLAENLQVTDSITFHGALSGFDLGVLYTEADAFLLTSNIEGWPMVIFDAIVAELPIIMTNVGCAGEMIKNEKNGLVVPVGDTDALVCSIKQLKEDSELAKRLTETAKVHLENYWSLDRILSGYKQSWEKALQETKN